MGASSQEGTLGGSRHMSTCRGECNLHRGQGKGATGADALGVPESGLWEGEEKLSTVLAALAWMGREATAGVGCLGCQTG